MSRRFSAVFLVVLALGATSGFSQDTATNRASASVDRSWREYPVPGWSIVVAQHGRIVFSKAVGLADIEKKRPARADTVYDMGSVSKANTAVAIMQLYEEGKVNPDDPIQKYVPSFPDKGYKITIWNLLTHTSGIRHYHASDFPGDENTKPYHSLAEAITIFKDDPLLFKPGQFYSYSSYGINLLQGVAEKASGLPFEEYMRWYVWGPAGMKDTAFDVPGRSFAHRAKSYVRKDGKEVEFQNSDLTYKFASGGMVSTAEDLALLGIALLHGKLLKLQTLELMWKPSLPDNMLQYTEGKPPHKMGFQQGLVWRLMKDKKGRRIAYHCGSVEAFGACLLIYRDDDLVVADMTNGPGSGGYPSSEELADVFLGPK